MNNKLAIGAALAGAVALGVTIVSFSNANNAGERSSGAFSEKDEAEIRRIVEDFLMENPKVIIDAVNKYAEQDRAQRAAQAEEATRELLPTLASAEAAFTAGPAEAKVTVIEFFDYHCGFCKRANGFVRDLTKDDSDVKMVFRELPIIRKDSELAAKYALAARSQEKYLQYHFALMDAPGILSEERLIDIAKKTGLDTKALQADANSPDIDLDVAMNLDLGQEISVDGTPHWIVASADGSYVESISGFRPEDITAAIERARNTGAKTGGGAN